jgi:hypothetical protein
LRVSITVLIVFLLFTPMIVEYFFASAILPFAQIIYLPWNYEPLAVFQSDIYFIEGAVLIAFGALVGGAILYNAWVSTDVRKVQFTEYIWNWKRIKEERDFPTGLTFGLLLMVIGIVYIISAIVVSH